jgi:hypothetical protein
MSNVAVNVALLSVIEVRDRVTTGGIIDRVGETEKTKLSQQKG